MLRQLGMLQSRRGHNVDSLSVACGVSRRTIFRDLDALREAGIPLVFDEQRQKYSIPSTYFLPPTNFTPEEALAVIVLCHEMGDQDQLPCYGAAQAAALKLESALPSRLRDQLRDLIGAIEINLAPVSELSGQTPFYNALVHAAAEKKSVRIKYGSLTEWEMITTKLSPYRVLFSHRSWYVIGRSSLHRSTRTFNLSRIKELELLDDGYKIPRGFSVSRYLRNAWHLIPSGPDRKVVIRFEKMVAQNVNEVNWHKTQKTKWNDDGSLEFRVTVSGLSEISWWIMGYGDQAKVLAPRELRNMIVQRAERTVERYRGKG